LSLNDLSNIFVIKNFSVHPIFSHHFIAHHFTFHILCWFCPASVSNLIRLAILDGVQSIMERRRSILWLAMEIAVDGQASHESHDSLVEEAKEDAGSNVGEQSDDKDWSSWR